MRACQGARQRARHGRGARQRVIIIFGTCLTRPPASAPASPLLAAAVVAARERQNRTPLFIGHSPNANHAKPSSRQGLIGSNFIRLKRRTPGAPPSTGRSAPAARSSGRASCSPACGRRREFRHSAAPPSSFSRRFNTDGRGASAEWQSRRWLGQPGVGDRVGLLVPQPLRDLLALVGLAARRADLPKSGTKEMMQTAV